MFSLASHPRSLSPGVRGKKQRGRQQGQAIVIIALMLTVLTGMVAIAIDGSRAYSLRRDLQAAIDASALAAADKLQQTASYVSAEQAATAIFGTNLRLYSSPACSGYGTPGPSPWTVTCTYPDSTVLTQVVRAVGPQGTAFTMSATRTLSLDFARILTNGTSPTIGAITNGEVDNLRFAPAIGALGQAGCGGASGSAITVNASGTMGVTGDIVSNGMVTVTSGAVSVAGDLFARCQATVPGAVGTLCYPGGGGTPCSYPDVAGATRSGFRLPDPGYAAPNVTGGSQGVAGNNVVLGPGVYAADPPFTGGHCWFLTGGVYEFLAGTSNVGDFVSNELKPPDEPDPANNTRRASPQFWDTDGVACSGSFQLTKLSSGAVDLPTGNWGFEVTSVRTDTYNGVTYTRESAPSMCNQIALNNHFDNAQITVSNVPGATSYNIYASPPGTGSACSRPFGLAANLPVSGTVSNANTNPCPLFTGNGCTLGHESMNLDTQLNTPFSPNAAAAPGTIGAYPPDPEQAPIASGLPNQNPARGSGSSGDRANENACKSVDGTHVACPAAVTPGAVELYYPAGACLNSNNAGDTYVFSGYQYDWLSVYEPASNGCANSLGAAVNTAYVGLVYAPSASVSVTSARIAESPGTGGVIAQSFTFTGALPTIVYSSAFAPVPPAARLIS